MRIIGVLSILLTLASCQKTAKVRAPASLEQVKAVFTPNADIIRFYSQSIGPKTEVVFDFASEVDIKSLKLDGGLVGRGVIINWQSIYKMNDRLVIKPQGSWPTGEKLTLFVNAKFDETKKLINKTWDFHVSDKKLCQPLEEDMQCSLAIADETHTSNPFTLTFPSLAKKCEMQFARAGGTYSKTQKITFYTNCGTCREAVLRTGFEASSPLAALAGAKDETKLVLDENWDNRDRYKVKTLEAPSCSGETQFLSLKSN